MLDRIQQDVREAMKQRDPLRVGTLRMLLAALKNKQIEMRDAFDERAFLYVVQKELKKRREAATIYQNAGDMTRARNEEEEASILQAYAPKEMGEEELRSIVRETIDALHVTTSKEMGRVMRAVIEKVRGKASGERVRVVVEDLMNAFVDIAL